MWKQIHDIVWQLLKVVSGGFLMVWFYCGNMDNAILAGIMVLMISRHQEGKL